MTDLEAFSAEVTPYLEWIADAAKRHEIRLDAGFECFPGTDFRRLSFQHVPLSAADCERVFSALTGHWSVIR